ncbi:dysbindin-like [Scleropages formosus]|uniref:dysbindin-like n=1 Tax=Scleropages formosus TaxID=113540 RepID=UPI0008791450|nr:dysbindin-like [Scleropages formosus]
MSSSGSSGHNKRLSSETEHTQRVPSTDAPQQIKWRERQRFFEEVFQHDMDVYLSSTHLQIEHRRPPVGSISSMEVNIDMLEQMELLEISDQEALDVFLNSSGEDGTLDSPLTEDYDDDENEDVSEEVYKDELLLEVPRSRCETKSRMSSTSSGSTDPYSLDTSEEGTDTPIVQSDDEEGQTEALLLKPNGAEEKSKNTHSS